MIVKFQKKIEFINDCNCIVDYEELEKASKVNSNTQLYKQAGNSIVVNVLMAIFRELIK